MVATNRLSGRQTKEERHRQTNRSDFITFAVTGDDCTWIYVLICFPMAACDICYTPMFTCGRPVHVNLFYVPNDILLQHCLLLIKYVYMWRFMRSVAQCRTSRARKFILRAKWYSTPAMFTINKIRVHVKVYAQCRTFDYLVWLRNISLPTV